MNEDQNVNNEPVDSSTLGSRKARQLRDLSSREEVNDILRQAGDIEVVEWVRNAGRDSYEARYLEDTLREVGVGALVNLQKTGGLAAAFRNRGLYTPTAREPISPSEMRSVIYVAVLAVSHRFVEEAVLEGGWSPYGRASLRTYFVNRCLYRLADEYRHFLRKEKAWTAYETSAGMPDDGLMPSSDASTRQPPGPEESIIVRDQVTRLLDGASVEVVIMFTLAAEGYTQNEIADRLGISAEAVSSAMRRFRQKNAARQRTNPDAD